MFIYLSTVRYEGITCDKSLGKIYSGIPSFWLKAHYIALRQNAGLFPRQKLTFPYGQTPTYKFLDIVVCYVLYFDVNIRLINSNAQNKLKWDINNEILR